MILLTDEEIFDILKKGIPFCEVEGRTVAKAQLKKVVEWFKENSSHYSVASEKEGWFEYHIREDKCNALFKEVED